MPRDELKAVGLMEDEGQKTNGRSATPVHRLSSFVLGPRARLVTIIEMYS
jgi:hypothetical protein